MNLQWKRLEKSLGKSTKSSICNYTINDYRIINSSLREGGFISERDRFILKNFEESYNKLDSYIKKPLVLYRGINISNVHKDFRYKFLSLDFNSMFYDNSYMSFTPDLNVAYKFAETQDNNSYPIILIINVDPEKYISPNLKDITDYNFYNEREVLINKGTLFDVVDIYRNLKSNITYISLEENLDYF